MRREPFEVIKKMPSYQPRKLKAKKKGQSSMRFPQIDREPNKINPKVLIS